MLSDFLKAVLPLVVVFFEAAFPWIAIGILVAVSCVYMSKKK